MPIRPKKSEEEKDSEVALGSSEAKWPPWDTSDEEELWTKQAPTKKRRTDEYTRDHDTITTAEAADPEQQQARPRPSSSSREAMEWPPWDTSDEEELWDKNSDRKKRKAQDEEAKPNCGRAATSRVTPESEGTIAQKGNEGKR